MSKSKTTNIILKFLCTNYNQYLQRFSICNLIVQIRLLISCLYNWFVLSKKYTYSFLSVLLFLCLQCPLFAKVNDDITSEILKYRVIEPPKVSKFYNYDDVTFKKVKLRVHVDIKSEKELQEGQIVYFETVENVYWNKKKIIEKGTLVSARVDAIITSGMNGIPASIIFSDFVFPNIDSNKFSDEFEKRGQDRSLIVFPLKWALTFLPPTGSLTNFIKGGHAKLSTKEIIELDFYPNRTQL